MTLSFEIHPSAWWKRLTSLQHPSEIGAPFSGCAHRHMALKCSFIISEGPFENLFRNAVNTVIVFFVGHTASVQLVKGTRERTLVHKGPSFETQRLRARDQKWEVTSFGPKSQKWRQGHALGAGCVVALARHKLAGIHVPPV